MWTGHKDGYVRIWSESSHNPVCPAFKAMHSDIRCYYLHLQSKAMKSCTTCCCSELNEMPWHCVILIAHCSNSLSGSQIG